MASNNSSTSPAQPVSTAGHQRNCLTRAPRQGAAPTVNTESSSAGFGVGVDQGRAVRAEGAIAAHSEVGTINAPQESPRSPTNYSLPIGASPDLRPASHPTPLPPSTPTKAAKILGLAPLADSVLVGVDSDDDEDESPKRPSLWRSGKQAARKMFANLSCLPSPFSPPPARQYLMPVLDTRDPDQLQANFVNSIGYVQHESAGRPRGNGGPSVSPSSPRRRRGRNGRRGGRSAVDRMAAIREAEGEDGVEGEEEEEEEDEEEEEGEEEEADLPSLRSSIDLDEEPTLHVAIAMPVRLVQPRMVNFG